MNIIGMHDSLVPRLETGNKGEKLLRLPIIANVTHRGRTSIGFLSNSRETATSSGRIPLVKKDNIVGFGEFLRWIHHQEKLKKLIPEKITASSAGRV